MMKRLLVGTVILATVGWGVKPLVQGARAEQLRAIARPAIIIAQVPDPESEPPRPLSQVKLLSQGAEPRQMLRFKPVINTKQTSVMTLQQTTSTALAGLPGISVNFPTMVVTVETVVTAVDPNGDIHYTFKYTDVQVKEGFKGPPQILEAMRSQMKKLKGLSGAIVMDDQSRIKAVDLSLPESVDPIAAQLMGQMSQMMEQVSVPLPETAVGVGAKWRTTTKATVNGVNLTQTATYDLTQFRANKATLSFTVDQTAAAQTIDYPLLPDVSLDLKSLKSSGAGQITTQLDRVMPLQSQLSATAKTEMQAKGSGLASRIPGTIQSTATVNVNLESKE